MTRNRTILLAVVAVVLLGAAFWWLDFRAAMSETRASSSVSTFASGQADQRLKEQDKGTLSVYVAGDGELAASLQRELRRSLPASQFFAEVVVLDEPAERAEGELLVVEIPERDVVWTPVYSQARLEVATAFSTNGDVSWRHGDTVQMTSEDPAVMVRGTYDFVDTTTGLISHKAYVVGLGRHIAKEIGKSLETELARQVS